MNNFYIYNYMLCCMLKYSININNTTLFYNYILDEVYTNKFNHNKIYKLGIIYNSNEEYDEEHIFLNLIKIKYISLQSYNDIINFDLFDDNKELILLLNL